MAIHVTCKPLAQSHCFFLRPYACTHRHKSPFTALQSSLWPSSKRQHTTNMLATTVPSVRARPVVPAQPVDPTTVCLIGIPYDITMRDIETIKIQLGPTVKVIDVQVPTDRTGATGLLFVQFADPYHVARVFDVAAVPGGIPAFGRLLMVKQATANWREQYMRSGRRPRLQASRPAPEPVSDSALTPASAPALPRPVPQSTPKSGAIHDEKDHDGHDSYDDVEAASARKRQSSAEFDDTPSRPYKKHVSQPPSPRSSRSAPHADDACEATPRSRAHTHPKPDTVHVFVSSTPKQVYPPPKQVFPPPKQVYPPPKQVYSPPPQRQSSTSKPRSGPASPSYARDRSAPPRAAPWARDESLWSQGASLSLSQNHAVKVEPPPSLPEATTKHEEEDPEQVLMRGSRWELRAAAVPLGFASSQATMSSMAVPGSALPPPVPAHPTGDAQAEVAVAVESASTSAATTYATAAATWISTATGGSHGHGHSTYGYHQHHQSHQNRPYPYGYNHRGRGRGYAGSGGCSGGGRGGFRSHGWTRGGGSAGRGSGWNSNSRAGYPSSHNQGTGYGAGRGSGRSGYHGSHGRGY
ncbi:hypothetical protein AMAG_11680 [Allomyces macrogynus ATCC 38327]|uniref:RRM domain-containing protein n=1 Tax=Allomyces macrogynus (strain ATCC 38327) TaxID=578462 RepID=A0A0L0SVR0_ALLM3|nr:hypothetical protein AMAG_11680 [Allomyces macrogynus ATCC 38327]|eukprot:KNE66551.1 hypothetical protein AMAG_11680 [Allomyces macrogynus ATCC 38327]